MEEERTLLYCAQLHRVRDVVVQVGVLRLPIEFKGFCSQDASTLALERLFVFVHFLDGVVKIFHLCIFIIQSITLIVLSTCLAAFYT